MFIIFSHTPTPDTYTLSLHDALPISTFYFKSTAPSAGTVDMTVTDGSRTATQPVGLVFRTPTQLVFTSPPATRSEEHTSELQSQSNLVCRLLLEKKKPTDTSRPRPLD